MSTFERWNTHFSTTCDVEVLGVNLRLAQDPNSEHLGTTVWDASIVLAKYFEKNIRKGDFSRPKATGKRAVELGAGMGLAGLAFALIGMQLAGTTTWIFQLISHTFSPWPAAVMACPCASQKVSLSRSRGCGCSGNTSYCSSSSPQQQLGTNIAVDSCWLFWTCYLLLECCT
eukprot:GHUV01045490.1.p1 GENE.GHUV01045490.1~~GHUV01045490.1.p1  ORF type:complete len:172 (+),score=20.38 GHUV01045490.1:270-785(+)